MKITTRQEDISDSLSTITVPTWVIACKPDKVDSVEVTKAELLSRIPHAVLHVVPGTGHLSPLESPAELVRGIDQFAAGLR